VYFDRKKGTDTIIGERHGVNLVYHTNT
jgi:hypothetical protein